MVPWIKTLLTIKILIPLSSVFILSTVKRGDDNEMFSVGQSLRIRVGPLKGYLCRVIAIRRSDVTVKLDSQQKILTGSYISLL